MRKAVQIFVMMSLVITCVRTLPAQEKPEAAPEDALGGKGESAAANVSTSANAVQKTSDKTEVGLFGRFVNDQQRIWTSPAQIRFTDMTWLVPAGGFTAGLLVTDRSFSKHLSQNRATINHYKTLSNAGVGALIGGAGGMWLLGHARHNEHWSETGFLAGEAALNSLVAVETLKYSLRRERPFQGNGSGSFFHSRGTSFPSEHAAAAWSVAGVVAHEYPGPLTKIMAYGLASLVDLSRIRSRQHFPSDVVVGSIMGNLIAQNIYSHHHDRELGGGEWRSISEIVRGEGNPSPANRGSPYVPLDSWIYPALDRLVALGVIDSGFAGMRPWTRSECARLLSEAGERIDEEGAGGSEAEKTYRLLETEFRDEVEGPNGAGNFRARLESVYARVTGISGEPLTDGYHFGQTIINDYGRPYQEGVNSVEGFSGWTTAGRWVGYVRAEYQHAPSAPALSASARQFIASADGLPSVSPFTTVSAVDRFRMLDAYVGLNFENWQVTFGRQSLWWGPGEGAAMMFSDNAEPINMFRINRVSPFQLPSILKFVGPVRMEFFVGQLSGHNFVIGPSGVTGSWLQPLNPQPLIEGEKLSFKPTPNFELGFSYSTIFGGGGVPATPREFVNSLFDVGGDLPDRKSKSIRGNGLDFSYRVPRLRKWLTFYGDGFANDELILHPYNGRYPLRAVWSGGIYVPMFPRLRRLDFRAEGGFTNNPFGGQYSRGSYYAGNRYLNGLTHNGNLFTSWLGRAGQGVQAWTSYWLSARSRLQLNFRHQKVGQQYLPGGGSLTDAGVRADYWLGSVGISGWVQHERWLFPVIQPNASRNVMAMMQVSFEPQKLFTHAVAGAAGITSRVGDRP